MIYRLVQRCNHECLSCLNSVKKHFITWPSISLLFFLSSFSLYLLGLYGFFQPHSHCSILSSYRVFSKKLSRNSASNWLYKSHNSDSGAEEQYHRITRLPGLSKKTCTQKYWMRYQTESLLLLLPNIFHHQRKPQKWLSSCKNK